MGSRGEFALIAALRERLWADGADSRVVRGSGDDAAVVRAGAYAVTSVDTMVDGVHFRLGQATPRDAGWRALAGALSDLAAMGVPAGEAYVALILPADLDDDAVLELGDGLGELARQTGACVIGGASVMPLFGIQRLMESSEGVGRLDEKETFLRAAVACCQCLGRRGPGGGARRDVGRFHPGRCERDRRVGSVGDGGQLRGPGRPDGHQHRADRGHR